MAIYKLVKENQKWVVMAISLIFAGCGHTAASVVEPIEKGWMDRSVLQGPPHRNSRQATIPPRFRRR